MKIALPKGRFLGETAALLQRAGLGLDGYHEKARLYRFKSQSFPNLSIKMFHEKDIPIQVAVGNYDLGICGLDWVEELLYKYPSSALVKVKNLRYGKGVLYMVGGQSDSGASLEQIKGRAGVVRITSEYPNLAESFALRNRLSRFSVFPVWGGAEAYPPDDAEMALISWGKGLKASGMVPISRVLNYSAFLIANKKSWKAKGLHDVVAAIADNLPAVERKSSESGFTVSAGAPAAFMKTDESLVRLALPDGHQQKPTLALLNRAGIQIDDYPSAEGNRRPKIGIEGVAVKVIRPQDMPLQVANGNFDIAITGHDWVTEHLNQFPSSPVKELLDLKHGKVRIVAVTSEELPVTDIAGLRQLRAEQLAPLRVASEYVNIADRYARDNHLGHYRVVPTWGATEAFLPEDADLLIENTETGQTIARHNLRIIDTIFESAACLVGNSGIDYDSVKGKIVKSIVDSLRDAVGGQ